MFQEYLTIVQKCFYVIASLDFPKYIWQLSKMISSIHHIIPASVMPSNGYISWSVIITDTATNWNVDGYGNVDDNNEISRSNNKTSKNNRKKDKTNKNKQ